MKTNTIVTGFVDYLKSEGEAELLPQISHELGRLSDQMDEMKKVQVVSAVPLTVKEKNILQDHLSKIFHCEVNQIENILDKDVIGGFRVQAGDMLIDATVQGQLQYLKKALLA